LYTILHRWNKETFEKENSTIMKYVAMCRNFLKIACLESHC